MSIGGRDEQRIRQTVKATEATPLPQARTAPQTRNPMTVFGTATQSLMTKDLGVFDLLRGTPANFSKSGKQRKAYACGSINVGSLCKLERCTSEGSGGFWAASPCIEIDTPRLDTHECLNCDGGEIVAPLIKIANLADLASKPQFDGWASVLNGVHQMEIVAAPETLNTRNCKAVLRKEVPYNILGQQQPGSEQFWVEFIPLFDFVKVVLNIGAQAAASSEFYDIQLAENRTSWPTNQFPRNGTQPICDSTYSDWTEVKTVTLRGESLETWFATPHPTSGELPKFTINPSQT